MIACYGKIINTHKLSSEYSMLWENHVNTHLLRVYYSVIQNIINAHQLFSEDNMLMLWKIMNAHKLSSEDNMLWENHEYS